MSYEEISNTLQTLGINNKNPPLKLDKHPLSRQSKEVYQLRNRQILCGAQVYFRKNESGGITITRLVAKSKL
jgi:hypothetical protein